MADGLRNRKFGQSWAYKSSSEYFGTKSSYDVAIQWSIFFIISMITLWLVLYSLLLLLIRPHKPINRRHTFPYCSLSGFDEDPGEYRSELSATLHTLQLNIGGVSYGAVVIIYAKSGENPVSNKYKVKVKAPCIFRDGRLPHRAPCVKGCANLVLSSWWPQLRTLRRCCI